MRQPPAGAGLEVAKESFGMRGARRGESRLCRTLLQADLSFDLFPRDILPRFGPGHFRGLDVFAVLFRLAGFRRAPTLEPLNQPDVIFLGQLLDRLFDLLNRVHAGNIVMAWAPIKMKMSYLFNSGGAGANIFQLSPEALALPP